MQAGAKPMRGRVSVTYEIQYSDGAVARGYASEDLAREAIIARYPNAAIGHDGDLSDHGDRTLAWACDADATDDDGARAIAAIRAEVES